MFKWFKKDNKVHFYFSDKEFWNFQFVITEPEWIDIGVRCKGWGNSGYSNLNACLYNAYYNPVMKHDVVCKKFKNGDMALFRIDKIKYFNPAIDGEYFWEGKRISFNDLSEIEKIKINNKFESEE